MRFKCWTILILALPLALGTACTGGNDATDNVSVTVKASYEKIAYGSGGLGSVTPSPARYAYAQLCRESDGTAIQGVDLDANGVGTISIPPGNVYAVVYADVAIPNGSDLLMQGSVIPKVPTAHYTATEFKNLLPWYVTSDSFTADSSGTITVRALESTGEAGAFAIADQMVEFALGMHRLEPTLPLPNLHAFWTTGTGDTNPAAVTDTTGNLIRSTFSSHPILAAEIPKDTNWRSVVYNDGRLIETFARGLFATGSSWTKTVGEEGSLVRADNDNALIDLGYASEPSIAFMSGFSHFLSCAIRNDASLYDVTVKGTPKTLRLDQSTGITPTGGGEFYAGSIARTLWGIWNNALGGGTSGLTTMWNATIPSQANQALEYGNAPLACYPTYLRGLRRIASTVSDSTFMASLGLENVGNGLDPISPSYFNGDALWQNVAIPFSGSGTLVTHTASTGIFYDKDQARSYRISFGGTGTLNLTLTPTSGQDFFLELIGPNGLVAARWDKPTGGAPTRQISLSSLPAGSYVVRIRAGYTTSDSSAAGYTLSITVN